jgi:hypothetical protein
LGNSYTSVNNLPALVRALAAAGGREVETDEYLPGGYMLEQHARDEKTLAKIRAKTWDFVVLQEQSLTPVLNRASMFKAARFLHEAISKQGAKCLFYLTWAREDIPQMQEGADPETSPEYAKAMFAQIGFPNAKPDELRTLCLGRREGLMGGLNGAYYGVADELGDAVAPVGVAWKKSRTAEPGLVLYQADKSHPTPAGSYLAACVFYATIFDKSPVGLPGELRDGFTVLIRLSPEDAGKLQEIAWQTVQEQKRIREKR